MAPRMQNTFVWQSLLSIAAPPHDPYDDDEDEEGAKRTRRTKTASRRLSENQTKTNRFDG
jgi:hypothetical protein